MPYCQAPLLTLILGYATMEPYLEEARMNLKPISQTAAFDSVTQIGRGIAKRKFENGFWRTTSIDTLVQALEVLPVGPQFEKARDYLHAIQDYDDVAKMVAETKTAQFVTA